MATKKQRDLIIKRTGHKLTKEDFKNRKSFEVEDVFEQAFFNKHIDGGMISTTVVERKEIIQALSDRHKLRDSYLNKIEELVFISKERVEKNPYYYHYCKKERQCIQNEIEGYIATKDEAIQSYAQIELDDNNIGYMFDYLSIKNLYYETNAIIMAWLLFKNDLDKKPTENTQNYIKPIREKIILLLQEQGVSQRRSVLLARHLINEHF